ncbi:hypothetical protein AB3S75_048034 [Citrus x aurantiifolia]
MAMPQKPIGVISQPQKKEPVKNQPESNYNIDNGSNNISSSSVVDGHDHDDDGFSSAGSRILMSVMSRSTPSQEPISRCSKFNKKRKHVQQVHQESSKKRTRKRDHSIVIINNDNSNEISTKLSLRDETWPTKEDTTQAYIPAEDMMRNQMLAYNIGLMNYYRPGEEEHESRIGVSTKLDLFTYPWSITKILTRSDLGHLSRLLVQTRLAERYVMPFLDEASRNEVIGNPEGLRVSVWDCDTNSMHRLVFKKWATSNSYVLINHWTADFVRRRELAAGDEIGMCWDSFYSRFNFSVLKRAPAPTIIVQDHVDVAAS